MEATKEHALWTIGLLAPALESLLEAYTHSVGGADGGVPSDLIQGATRIAPDRASVYAAGPADCVAQDAVGAGDDAWNDDARGMEHECGAALDGGIDDVLPVQLWDRIMQKYKAVQLCDEELARMKKKKRCF